MSYQNRKSAGERSVGLIFVVLFHVLLVWGLASGLAHDLTAKVSEVIQTKVVEDDKPKEEVEPPPPPPDTKIPPPDFVPPPSFDFVPDVGPTNAIQAVSKEAPKPAAPTAMTQPKSPAKGQPALAYPTLSERAGEEGSVLMNLYVDENGRVADVKITSSSGFERLDEAAVKQAKSKWKFTPCMQGDKPVGCWYPFKYTWKMQK